MTLHQITELSVTKCWILPSCCLICQKLKFDANEQFLVTFLVILGQIRALKYQRVVKNIQLLNLEPKFLMQNSSRLTINETKILKCQHCERIFFEKSYHGPDVSWSCERHCYRWAALNRGIRDNTNLTMGLILPIGSNWLIDYLFPLWHVHSIC